MIVINLALFPMVHTKEKNAKYLFEPQVSGQSESEFPTLRMSPMSGISSCYQGSVLNRLSPRAVSLVQPFKVCSR